MAYFEAKAVDAYTINITIYNAIIGGTYRIFGRYASDTNSVVIDDKPDIYQSTQTFSYTVPMANTQYLINIQDQNDANQSWLGAQPVTTPVYNPNPTTYTVEIYYYSDGIYFNYEKFKGNNPTNIPCTLNGGTPLKTGYNFMYWLDGENLRYNGTTYFLSAGSYTFNAYFEQSGSSGQIYTISLDKNIPNQNIASLSYSYITNGKEYSGSTFPVTVMADQVTFTAVPYSGYEIYQWTFDGYPYPDASTTKNWVSGGMDFTVSVQAKQSSGGGTDPTPDTDASGYVWVYNGSKWVKSIPWVYNGSKWIQTIPWVYTEDAYGTKQWIQCGSSTPDIIL